MSEPRYIVRESSGYRINLPIHDRDSPSARVTVEVLVLDRDDCYCVVWSSETATLIRQRTRLGKRHGRIERQWRNAPLEERREYASDLAVRLNAEDAQAREGTVSC